MRVRCIYGIIEEMAQGHQPYIDVYIIYRYIMYSHKLKITKYPFKVRYKPLLVSVSFDGLNYKVIQKYSNLHSSLTVIL